MDLPSIDSGIFSLENSELVGNQEETKEANQQSKLSPVTESPQDQSFLIEGFPTKEDEISPENSYNILLLGETGVGKTTFINAGANYTAFDSMKEALEMGPIIPMDISFTSTRGMKLFPVKIPSSVSNGDLYSNNECDQPGLSKTQSPMIHKIHWRSQDASKVLNIIDTPGVMDTDGDEKDDQNLQKVFKLLEEIGVLHAVLILLKPNVARLLLGFRRALEKILTTLHETPQENIIFCFTNSQSFDYRPGDTINPLNSYLNDFYQRKSIALKADKSNMFCFDSCCFRFMCEIMADETGEIENSPHKPTQIDWQKNASSWKKLFAKIEGLTPCSVKCLKAIETYEEEADFLVEKIQIQAGGCLSKRKEYLQMMRDLNLIANKKLEVDSEEEIVYKFSQLDHKRKICTNYNCNKRVRLESGEFEYKPKADICMERPLNKLILNLQLTAKSFFSSSFYQTVENRRREGELQRLEMASIEIKRKMLELKKEIEEIERKIEKVVECAAELTASVANTLMFEYFNEQLENLITKEVVFNCDPTGSPTLSNEIDKIKKEYKMRTQTILREVANAIRVYPSIKEKKESPFSFLKDESTDIITAIHSIVLIKEIHWILKETIINFILDSRMDGYFAWIEINMDPDSYLHKHWAYGLARWRLLNKGKSHKKNIKGMVEVYAELKKDLKQNYNSGNITTRNSNAKEEKQQYYQETCLCKLHNNNCRRCRTPSAAERFKRQNGTLHPAPTGGIASPTEEKAYQSLPQEAGYVIINHLDKQTQGEPSSFDNTKVADDDDPDMRDMSILAIPLNVREEPTSFIDVNRQQTLNYGTTSQNRAQDAQKTPYFGLEGSSDINRYGIFLTSLGAPLDQQNYERNDGTSLSRGSEMVLDVDNLVSPGQQKERNQKPSSEQAHDANNQKEIREQSAFAHVQQRLTSCTSDSLENGYSFVEKPPTNVQQGSVIHGSYSTSQEAQQDLPSRKIQLAENGEESLDKTNEQESNKDSQASVDSFQQKELMGQEASISQEEQSSVAQGVQPENKEESAQSNRNEKAEDKNGNSVQMEYSTKQSIALEEGSDQKSQEKPKITSTDPAVTSKGAEENNIREGWGSETRIRTTQKSPRAYSQAMASSRRSPLQPFPRVANKKAEISHYSPSINLTNKEGIAAYNLILVGDSNVGKTTLFNSSANYLLSESEAEAFRNPMFLSDVSFRVTENSRPELISVQANFKSEDGLARNSSQYPFMEEITYYDPESGKMKMLRILDTPGINDEKGTINVENILKAAKLMGEIHGIGILIGPNEVRMKMNFTLALNRLLGQFHKSAIKNLLFFYTKVSGPTYAPGDGYPLVENYLKAAKIDLPLDLENVFRFDNGWFRSLCIEQFNSKNGKVYEVPARTGWSHSKNEMERLMKRLSKSKEPYKMDESVFLDETKRFLEELAEPVSQCLLKYIEKSYEIEGIAKDRDQPQLMVNGVKEEAELKKTFDKILKKCSQLAAFLQKNTIVPGVDPFLEHFTSLRDIEKEKDQYNRVKSHHLPKLQSTCEKYVAELNNAINDVKKPNIEGIKTELVGMTHFNEIFYNAFGGKMKF